MKILTYLLFLSLLFSCESNIKNENAKVVVEEGTEVPSNETNAKTVVKKNNNTNTKFNTNRLLGFWVGYFEKDDEKTKDNYGKNIFADEGFQWNRDNKINISIDEIEGHQVEGHSVVAGNDRPFRGTILEVNDPSSNFTRYEFEVKEPGDDKYDGTFKFSIEENKLKGKWSAFKKN